MVRLLGGDFLHCFGFEDCWSLKTYARVFLGRHSGCSKFFSGYSFFSVGETNGRDRGGVGWIPAPVLRG